MFLPCLNKVYVYMYVCKFIKGGLIPRAEGVRFWGGGAEACPRRFSNSGSFATRKLYAHYTILCLGVFCKFLGDLRVYLGGDSFFSKDW